MADDGNKLSYEEAAEILGVSVDELRDLRADGRIRDHADYGTWTFKTEDVQTLKDELQAEADAAGEPPEEAETEADSPEAGDTKSYTPSKYEPGGDTQAYTSKYQSTSYETPKYDTPKYDTPDYSNPTYETSSYEPEITDEPPATDQDPQPTDDAPQDPDPDTDPNQEQSSPTPQPAATANPQCLPRFNTKGSAIQRPSFSTFKSIHRPNRPAQSAPAPYPATPARSVRSFVEPPARHSGALCP